MQSYSPESEVLAHRWLLAKGKHLIVHLFVSCVLFVFVFEIKSLLVCYCTCSLPLIIFASEEIIYRSKEIKISSTNINMTNPEKGRKWFSRSVASMINICS